MHLCNNRCIRSKISDQGQPWLSRGWIECEIVTLAGSRWALNYYITLATGSLDQLEIRCCRENQHPAEGDLRTPDWAVRVQMSWREDAGMRTMYQRGWAPRPLVEQPRRTGKKCCYGHKSGGGQYVAVLFSLQLTSHTVKPLVTLSNPFK